MVLARKRMRIEREEGLTQGREEGRAEGREEGRTEGRAEGRTEGREEGRAQAHAELEPIIRNLQERIRELENGSDTSNAPSN